MSLQDILGISSRTQHKNQHRAPALGAASSPPRMWGQALPNLEQEDNITHLLPSRFQLECSTNHQHGPGAVKAWTHPSYLISLTYFQSTKCQRQVPGMRSCTEASIGILDNSTQHGDVLSPKEHAERQMDFFFPLSDISWQGQTGTGSSQGSCHVLTSHKVSEVSQVS